MKTQRVAKMIRPISSAFVGLLMLVLLMGWPVGDAMAQGSPACNKHCGPYDFRCHMLEKDCYDKLSYYYAYFAQMGTGVQLFSLPALYIELLQPSYPKVNLNDVRFGFSQRQFSRGITDCKTIYFPHSDYVDKVRFGTLVKGDVVSDPGMPDTDALRLLYHELRHTEQCAEVGGREAFAVMWWGQLDMAAVQNPDPTTIHNRMPMEPDAAARAIKVDRVLPDGLIRLSISSLTANQVSPQAVNVPITWTANSIGGRTPIDFSFEVTLEDAPTVVAQGFGPRSSFNWTPTVEGTYKIKVRARQSGSSEAFAERKMDFNIGVAGGTGGTPFLMTCNSSAVMVGIKAWTGQFVDSVEAVCMAVNSNGSWRKSSRLWDLCLSFFASCDPLGNIAGFDYSISTRTGGDGGSFVNLICDEGWAVMGLFGKSGTLVDSLGVRCGKLGAVGNVIKIVSGNTTQDSSGGHGGNPFDLLCQSGQIAQKLYGRSGTLIDQIGVICFNPVK